MRLREYSQILGAAYMRVRLVRNVLWTHLVVCTWRRWHLAHVSALTNVYSESYNNLTEVVVLILLGPLHFFCVSDSGAEC